MQKLPNTVISLAIIFGLLTCQSDPATKSWTFNQVIDLDTIAPISIIAMDNGFWVADSDNNSVYSMSEEGKVKQAYLDFDRPMHMDWVDGLLLIPEYGSDTIRIITGDDDQMALPLLEEPDAPAGVSIEEDRVLVADFYNHRVIYQNEDQNLTFGSQGHQNGEFNYPTDVQFANNQIYVADAYNNRIQIFDLEGQHKQTIGEEDNMNAATGIFVTSSQLFVTDYENSRVLIYDLTTNELQQVLEDQIDKPTDLFVKDNKLYVANYGGNSISVFTH